MNLGDKVVLITGAGVGIGRAAALRFSQEGAKVAVNSLTPENGQETLRLVLARGGQGIYVQGDVSRENEARHMVEETIKAYGRLNILVNNAGAVNQGRVDNTSEEEWDRVMAVNLKGAFLVSKWAIPEMRKSGGGAIVNVSSITAIRGAKDRAVYAASKGGLVALTRAMAADYLSDHIRVNCICPGTTDTPMVSRLIQSFRDPAAAMQDLMSRMPMGRLGKAEEVAAAILFAASDESSFINGETIVVDGGKTSLIAKDRPQ